MACIRWRYFPGVLQFNPLKQLMLDQVLPPQKRLNYYYLKPEHIVIHRDDALEGETATPETRGHQSEHTEVADTIQTIVLKCPD